MDKISQVRSWLTASRGQWTQIARRTGLSTKTIQRFVKDDSWNFTMSTYHALELEMERSSHPSPASESTTPAAA
ncbi:hypothetical protein [Burkholderia gladioli]|uniref:hypothetical protein n=1 Tax=Burkholderia gladioli TaxID=28095 RepID=UPI003D2540C5